MSQFTPQSEHTLEVRSSTKTRREFHNQLKESAGISPLETVPADPDLKNIPENISSMLEVNSSALLAISQSKYTCVTQEGLPVSPAETSDPLSLWIGWGGSIPRWKKGQVVQFAALAGGYPTRNHAIFAAYKLNEAAVKWNSLRIGVTFRWVSKLEDAAFVLAYGGDQGTVLARAFFPNSNNLNTLFVYQKAFDPVYSQYQANIFLHELGHVLGLRHEFAAQEGGAVEFGPANPLSVMSYTFPPNIRDSDETSTRAFYNYTPPTFKGLRIVDWIPDN
jgi:hypothetical protein